MAAPIDEPIEELDDETIEQEDIEENSKIKKKSSESKTKSSIISWLEGLFKEEGPE